MKLQPHHAVAVHERLLRASVAFRHSSRAGRQRERVAVPVHDGEFRGKGRERSAPVKDADRPPADFLLRVLEHLSPEHVRKELRAEAYPEDRFPRRDGIADEALFHRQPRMGAMLVDIHRAAHDHQQVKGGGRRRRLARIKRGAADAVTARRRPVSDPARPLVGLVLERMDVQRRVAGGGAREIRRHEWESIAARGPLPRPQRNRAPEIDVSF